MDVFYVSGYMLKNYKGGNDHYENLIVEYTNVYIVALFICHIFCGLFQTLFGCFHKDAYYDTSVFAQAWCALLEMILACYTYKLRISAKYVTYLTLSSCLNIKCVFLAIKYKSNESL